MTETETTATTFKAKHRFVPMSARKARYVVDLVRGRSVNEALRILQFCPRRASPVVEKVLRSAVANASLDLDVDANRLYVSDVRADNGPTLKRGKARSRGQYFGILVHYCHVSVVLREAPEEGAPVRGGKRGVAKRKRVRVSRRRRGGGSPSASKES
jgi:large subunit ribosomal protein L22